ncbi:MAG: cysteine desulfurase [Chitinophagaceae bacterium]|nr:cysteine desulfurase [Chitinophagaceae bacterium]
MKNRPIYLDYNSTTPCDPAALEAMMPWFNDHFGNAASKDHWYGWHARDGVDEAREQVATLIGAKPREIVFTSGATEAINLALKGIAETNSSQGNHIITCKTEHKAVLDTCTYLETKGFQITYLDVDSNGNIDIEGLKTAISDKTICIALMFANNETGVIHPVKKIGMIAAAHNIPFFCDATQTVGKIPVNVNNDGIQLMAFSAHKMYGPKGAGALFISGSFSAKTKLSTQQHGGAHENGLRSGTLNTPAIVGFGKAAELCRKNMNTETERLERLRNDFEQALLTNIPGVVINGAYNRLSHVSNFSLPGMNAEQLLLSVSRHIAASRGSACSGLIQQPSHVLAAMGISAEQNLRSVRISVGRFSTTEEVDQAVLYITRAVMEKQQLTTTS